MAHPGRGERSSRVYFTDQKVNDTNHMKWVTWPWWTPADAWISSK